VLPDLNEKVDGKHEETFDYHQIIHDQLKQTSKHYENSKIKCIGIYQPEKMEQSQELDNEI